MINLIAFIHSLKLTWIRRVFKNSGTWTIIFDKYINTNQLVNFGQGYCESVIKFV